MLEPLFQLLVVRQRISFRWRNRNRRKLTESTLSSIRARVDDASKAGLPHYATLYNAGLFFILVDQDIFAFSESILMARSEWHRQFFSRSLAVLLYEASEDMPQILGKDFRKALGELENGALWLERLNPISAKFAEFRASQKDFLKTTRNLVGAHRDHDAIAQLRLLDELKSVEIYRLAAEFSVPLRQLSAFFIALLPHMQSLPILLAQISKSIDSSGGKLTNHKD